MLTKYFLRGVLRVSNLLTDFLNFAKINTRSDEASETIPTTKGQIELAHVVEERLKEIGLDHISFYDKNCFVIGRLPGQPDKEAIGFIAHLDTADYNAENIQPIVWENYRGNDLLLNKELGVYLRTSEFPNLFDYVGETLITTSGDTLLGADDKAGIAEILGLLEYYRDHPDISRGDIWVAFGPDEEIGRGADRFEVADFPVSFAYTIDSGRVGHFEYETFNAAKIDIEIQGTAVHTGTAYGRLVNAIKLGEAIDQALPQDEVPEKTRGYEGFYFLHDFVGSNGKAELSYIIRDHDSEQFAERKKILIDIINNLNQSLDRERITYTIKDQYYNMRQVIDKHPEVVDLAVTAMKNLGIEPIVEPFRGGTDGSKISLKGIPTPNIFTGGENFHGQFEFITLEAMEKARDTLIEIVRLNGEKE